jgi:hypothetical protein
VVTTASLQKDEENKDDTKARLVLRQVAKKNGPFRFDSEIVFEACDGELVMTTTVETDKGPVSGTRQMMEYDLDKLCRLKQDSSSQRGSFSHSPFIRSPRASFSVSSRKSSKEIPEEMSQQLATLQVASKFGRRLSMPKVSENLLTLKPTIEISHHE